MNVEERPGVYKPKVKITQVATGQSHEFDQLPDNPETPFDFSVRQAQILRLFKK